MITIGQCATLACLLEVAAPKPGNVHRAADFEDATLSDYLASGVAIGPIMDRASQLPLGQTVLQAVQATQQLVASNTNLGMILLFAPLASVPASMTLAEGIPQRLRDLGPADAALVYQAIRLAKPGGIQPRDDEIREHDVADAAPPDLLTAMEAAADRDLVAKQYTNGFHEVLHVVVPWLLEPSADMRLSDRIVHTHVRLMHAYPDCLIARKCGHLVAEESSARAAVVLDAGTPGSEAYVRAISDLDFWLRSDGTRRNPGTSADLVAAGLFVLLRDGKLQPPFN
jgi:triphosphoribosyl-dephospho-CoA synthase